MSEVPQDPLKAAALARITAHELAEDARVQSAGCAQGAATITTLAETVDMLARLELGGADAEGSQKIRAALESVAQGMRAVAVALGANGVRFAAHGSAWDREAAVWAKIMELGGAPAAPTTPEPVLA